jgi:hypothetical protein
MRHPSPLAVASGGIAKPSRSSSSSRPRRLFVLAAAAAATLLLAASPLRSSAQLTLYLDTPLAAASGSVDLQARAGVAPDATVHVGGGVAASGAAALRNPLLAALGTAAGTEEAGRPQATTAAYVATPLSVARTLRPTVGFHFGEARGALGSGTAGGFLVGEFGYNPIANQLGASVSGGSAGTANARSGDTMGGVLAAGDAAGLSGAESLGWADAQTTAGGGRGAQESQAIAYPTNLASPLNPATCTQALTYGAARSNYGPDGSALPLVRGNEPSAAAAAAGENGEDGVEASDGYGPAGGGAWGVPLCLALFDWGTLDDFVAFVDEGEGGGGRRGRSSSGRSIGSGDKQTNTNTNNNEGDENKSDDGASFEDYVEHPGGAGKPADSQQQQRRRRRDESAALRAAAAGGPAAAAAAAAASPPSSSTVQTMADVFERGGPAAVDAFLQTTETGREMLRRAEATRADRQGAYDRGNRTSLRGTFLAAAAALAPAAADAARAGTRLRNVAARNATNLAVQALVGVAESAEPALALQQRARAALVDPVRAASARLASSGLRRAAAGLERQERQGAAAAGGGGEDGNGGGQGMGRALGDAAAALRASAALAAADAADAVVAAASSASSSPQQPQQQQGGGGGGGSGSAGGAPPPRSAPPPRR